MSPLDTTFRRNLIVYTLASAMGGLLSIANLLWTHLLDQADYGRFAVLEGVVFGFASVTVTLAPQQYILVYVHKKPRSELAADLGGLLSLAFVVGALTMLAILLVPGPFSVLRAEGIPRWAVAGVVLAATLAAARMMAQSIHETLSEPVRAALWTELVDGSRPFIALAIFFLVGWTWEARWGGLVLAQAGAGIAALWILSREGWLRRPSSRISLKEPLLFSLPMMVAGLAYVGYQSADRLYVALWGGIAAAGRYEAAYRLALLVNTVNLVTLKSFNPLFYSAYGRGDRQEAAKLLRKTTLQAVAWIALLVALLPMLAVHTPILEESYRSSPAVIDSIPVLAAGLGLLGIAFLWQAPLLAHGKAKAVSLIAITSALSNLGTDLVLIPRMGEVGAAWGTFIAFALMLSLTVIVGRRLREAE